MPFAVTILLIAAIGGFALTYLFDDNSPVLYRVAAGSVIGMAIFGFAGAILGFAIGLSMLSVLIAAIISALPVLILRDAALRDKLAADFKIVQQQTVETFSEFHPFRLLAVTVYTGLFTILCLFFNRAMIEMPDGGIGTGAANNLGDLPFHILVINGFATGQNFPPDNPIYSGATISYPFITDLIAAMLNVAGASVREAMLLQNIVLVTAMLALLAAFTRRISDSPLAAAIAPFLLVFSGGLGFLLFLGAAVKSEAGIFGQIAQLNADYTLRGGTIWRWGNSLTTLFVTQRTLLLGLPIALIVFTRLYDFFVRKQEPENDTLPNFLDRANLPFLIVGAVAGLLPLIHSHTFLVVVSVAGFLALLQWQLWRMWIVFFVGLAVSAIPQLIFAISGTATAPGSFFGWEFGWDNGDHNALLFWFVNTGIFIPLLIVAVAWLAARTSNENGGDGALNGSLSRRTILFYLPFAILFAASNSLRLAPWIWDNVKVLIYWYVASIPLAAWLLAEIWRRSLAGKLAFPVLLTCLVFSGFLDVIRVATGQVEHQIFSPAVVGLGDELSKKLPKDAVIMTAPEYATLPVLTGRKWFLGYTGHVWSHGIDGNKRDAAVRSIYAGSGDAKQLIQENGIQYIVVGPQERQFAKVNEAFFSGFELVAERGDHKVYFTGTAR